MHTYTESTRPSLSDLEQWLTFGTGLMVVAYGVSRRSTAGIFVAAASAPILYRGLTGRWPGFIADALPDDDTRTALADDRGLHVRESIRVERPIAEVYRFWRQFENLPQFMRHLVSVTETGANRSHWVAEGPAGVRVEWDAEIINDVEPQTIGWRSLPGADVVTAGSVNFDTVRGGATQITVRLQYAPPAGRAGALVATLFGRAPEQTIREDLRQLKQLLEAGEVARAYATPEAVLR